MPSEFGNRFGQRQRFVSDGYTTSAFRTSLKDYWEVGKYELLDLANGKYKVSAKFIGKPGISPNNYNRNWWEGVITSDEINFELTNKSGYELALMLNKISNLEDGCTPQKGICIKG